MRCTGFWGNPRSRRNQTAISLLGFGWTRGFVVASGEKSGFGLSISLESCQLIRTRRMDILVLSTYRRISNIVTGVVRNISKVWKRGKRYLPNGFLLFTGWGAGIRTPILAFKGQCPTVRRPPNVNPAGSILTYPEGLLFHILI